MRVNPKTYAKLFGGEKKIDTAKQSLQESGSDGFLRNDGVLTDAYNAWKNLDRFRATARRYKDFVFGDQWGDLVKTRGGRFKTERQTIIDQGNAPLSNNILRGLMRSISGLYYSQPTEPVCQTIYPDSEREARASVMTAAIRDWYSEEEVKELDGNIINEYGIAGICCWRQQKDGDGAGMKPRLPVYCVGPNEVFFNQVKDVRMRDLSVIGEIHDMSLLDIQSKFSRNRGEAERIARIYSEVSDRIDEYGDTLVEDYGRHKDFFQTNSPWKCRVIEVWKKESKEVLFVHDRLDGTYEYLDYTQKNITAIDKENRKREAEQTANGVSADDMLLIDYEWKIRQYWHYYFLTPTGHVISHGESPYWHGEHPYTLSLHSLYDGQAFPFVGDSIDPQKSINRMLVLMDFMMRAGSKGVLMIPEDCIPAGKTVEDIADEWHRYNGVILYTPSKYGKEPHQVSGNAIASTNIVDVLSIMLKQMGDISGVHGAIQGKEPASGTAASLYAQQAQNASVSLLEFFETFRHARERRDRKCMSLIQQYYTEPVYLNITSANMKPALMQYNPEMVRNAEFSVTITEGQTTPVMRGMMNDWLMQIFDRSYQSGAMTVQNLVSLLDVPWKDELLQILENNANAMKGGGQVQGIPPELQEQISAGQSPIVQQMLGGGA